MSELYKQVRLEAGTQRIVCWLPCEKVRLYPGLRLTLEGDEDKILWTVQEVYDRTRVSKEQLYKPWRVGGLS